MNSIPNNSGNKIRNKSIDQLGSTSSQLHLIQLLILPKLSKICLRFPIISSWIQMNWLPWQFIRPPLLRKTHQCRRNPQKAEEKRKEITQSPNRNQSRTLTSQMHPIFRKIMTTMTSSRHLKKKDSWKLIAYLTSQSNFGIRCNFWTQIKYQFRHLLLHQQKNCSNVWLFMKNKSMKIFKIMRTVITKIMIKFHHFSNTKEGKK